MPGQRWTKRACRFKRADDGAVILEFVMVLPLLLSFLIILIGVGQGLWYHQVVTKGVRDGVRYLSRAPLEAAFIANAKRVALTGTPDGSDPAFTFWNDPNTIAVTSTDIVHGGAFRGPDPLTTIRMTASVPVSIPVLAWFDIGPTITLIVSDEGRHIGE